MTDKKQKPDPVPARWDATNRGASPRATRGEEADGPQRAGGGGRRRQRSRARHAEARARAAAMTAKLERRSERDVPPRSAGEPEADGTVATGEPNIAARIRELEERLDRMIVARTRERDAHPSSPTDGSSRETSDSAPPAARPTPRATPPPLAERKATSRELLSTDFYLRQWGRLGLRDRSEEIDDFGYDPAYEQKVLPLFDFLYEKYFRLENHGIERIPKDGRCLLVANHSGTLPVDGMMLRLAVRREHPEHRDVRWLAEDAIFHFPFLGTFTNRVGAVRACQENAERLLNHGALVAVFPEGTKGIGKLFRDRYKLQRFGRGGFVKLCLRTGTPVVPVAIIGSEETNPLLARNEYLAKALGVPYFPVTPTFPLLGPLGLLPAPTKWKLYFGEPIDFGGHGAEAAEDEILVGRLAERVRGEIQSMLDRGLASRRSIWFG
jgi:1-acyl-sn-glycerol-3-phosphate acyltransferase